MATGALPWRNGPAPADVAKLILRRGGDLRDVEGNGRAMTPGTSQFVPVGGVLVLTSYVLPDDFNGDGVVIIIDGVGIRKRYGTADNPGDLTALWADMDGDRDVNLDDFNVSRLQAGQRELV